MSKVNEINYQAILQNLNEDNYCAFCEVDTIEELVEEMKEYYENHFDFEDEEVELEKFIKSKIEWNGNGEYCICGIDICDDVIINTKEAVLEEIQQAYALFPYNEIKTLDDIEDFTSRAKAIKEEYDCKYMYLFYSDFGKRLEYVILANEELDTSKDIVVNGEVTISNQWFCYMVEIEDLDAAYDLTNVYGNCHEFIRIQDGEVVEKYGYV